MRAKDGAVLLPTRVVVAVGPGWERAGAPVVADDPERRGCVTQDGLAERSDAALGATELGGRILGTISWLMDRR